MIFDFPCELGYHCPKCKYKNTVNGEYDTRLNWSEYEGFLWCSVCNKDYPSCLCMPDKDKATDIYLDCLSYQRQQILQELKKMEIGEDKGWDYFFNRDQCCPGDDYADIYNKALKNVAKMIKSLIKK